MLGQRRIWFASVGSTSVVCWVRLLTKFRFNVGPALQPIACSMPVNRLRRWPNTDPSLGPFAVYLSETLGIHPMLFQCWPTVFDAGPTLKQPSVIVIQVTLFIPAPETPHNTIRWPNADVMLWHWAKIIPTKTLYALITIFDSECIFFWTLFKDESIDPRDLKRYIWLVYRNVNRFPHTAPLFPPNRTQTQAK